MPRFHSSPLWRRLLCGAALLFLLGGCLPNGNAPPADGAGPDDGFSLPHIAKGDIDLVVESHQRQVLAHLEELARKLYRRNPREWQKADVAGYGDRLESIFSPETDWNFPELEGRSGVGAIRLAFKPGFEGDRVFALTAGMASMILKAYDNKTEFYVWDDLDPQKLYHAARNVEIAAWLLNSTRDDRDRPLILANTMDGEGINLSFERLLGKVISLQDMMAQIIAQKTRRSIRHAVQFLAGAVFFPI